MKDGQRMNRLAGRNRNERANAQTYLVSAEVICVDMVVLDDTIRGADQVSVQR